MSKSQTDLIEEMLDSMNCELGAELSECETTEFNGHTVVLVAARDIGVPGRRGVLYVDGLERAHADAVSILAVPKAPAVSGQQHDNLRDNIGQAIKDGFDEIDAEITGFDIHDARDIDIFTDKVMKVLAGSTPADPNEALCRALHYPDHWDTAAYPDVCAALSEVMATFECDCATPAGHSVPVATESEPNAALAVVITKSHRDGNWQEFDVNGHGGMIRVVARMEDDDEDSPLGKLVEKFLLTAPQPNAQAVNDLLLAIGNYAEEKGESWRISHPEIMDAYQAATGGQPC